MSDYVKKITNDYLTAEELAAVFRLKNHRTIHNWVYSGVFEKGVEYIKLRGILLFYWPAIRDRLHSIQPKIRKKPKVKETARRGGCRINL